MISCKFLGANGGTTANAVKAVDYMTDLKTRHGLNLIATSNSWGGGAYSQAIKDAIARAEGFEVHAESMEVRKDGADAQR